MKHSLPLRGLIALSILTVATPALADGLYLGLRGGWSTAESANLNGPGLGDIEYSNGYIVGGAVGYAWANGLRLEAELTRRSNDPDAIGIAGSNRSAEGEVTADAAMANLLYDFKLGSFPLEPYVGVGAGAVRVRTDDVRVANVPFSDDRDTVFGVQGIAGVSYAFTPRIRLTLDYRYMYAPDVEFSSGTRFDTNYRSQAVTAGFRFDF
jgi:opacity protein-like surface antigen